MLNINLNFKQKSTKEKYNPIIEKDSIFKPIKGFENMYEISNYGIIKSVDRNIICKDGQIKHIKSRYIRPADNGHGYKFVNLWKDNNVIILDSDNIISPTMLFSYNYYHNRNNKILQCC